jgi:ribosomal protein S14
MLSAKIKDKKHRDLFAKLEKKKLLNKFIFINLLNRNSEFCSKEIKLAALRSILYEKYNSKVRINRRCVFNNRNRGVLRAFGVSRMCLRELMLFGLAPGYSKAVW